MRRPPPETGAISFKRKHQFLQRALHLAWDSVRRQGDDKPGWDKAEEVPLGNPLRNDLRAAPQYSIDSKIPQTQARLGGPGGSRTHGVLSEADYEATPKLHRIKVLRDFPLRKYPGLAPRKAL